jgi:hypothetical protein
MAEAVSRRSLTAEILVRFRVSPCGFCGGQSGTGTGFSQSTSVFPCQFHSTGAPLNGKAEKNLIIFLILLHNKPSRLLCVRSICCGALHHKKNLAVLSLCSQQVVTNRTGKWQQQNFSESRAESLKNSTYLPKEFTVFFQVATLLSAC